MKVYCGARQSGRSKVVVIYDEGEDERRDLARRDDVRDYSGFGFSWGLPCTGAQALSLAILYDTLGDSNAALQWHILFARDVVGTFPGPTFSLTIQEVHQELDILRARVREEAERRKLKRKAKEGA